MQKILLIASLGLFLNGCAVRGLHDTYDQINTEVAAAARQPSTAAQNAAVDSALLPPATQLAEALPKARAVLEERFNVSFNNVPVQQFYNSLVAGTRYNMLINPEVAGNVSANLKDVTLVEALDAMRELYGYDYKVEGTRIYIRPLTLQSRMFQVNYLTSVRKGMSSLRVSSTSVANAGTSNSGGQNNNNNSNNNNNNDNNNGNDNNGNNNNNGNNGRQRDSSNVQTASQSDFWGELKVALEALVDVGKAGRSVVISPQSGVIVVRAMPDELRNVEMYLKATQLSVERQVILEAKILEVELNSSYQTGVNWAAFGKFAGGPNNRLSAGVLTPGTTLSGLSNPQSAIASTGKGALGALTGQSLASSTDAAGTMFGLAFQTSNFAALISFLESQGTVHVLSSPRIATLNNQKAVLKIGTDEFYVTGVSTTTTSTGVGAGTTTPTVTLQPFFSGVVLDVTPQIDDHGNITLHVHPSVSQVSTVNKGVNLGTAGNFSLPLAASATSEMDSMVRGQDGKVVAIGGLMRQATTSDRSQVPVAGNIPVLGALFGNTGQVTQKRELVVLIKPTIVESGADWTQDLLDAGRRVRELNPRQLELQR